MRILVLTNFYPPHAYGGYESMCAQVVERWRARGHSLTVLTSNVTVPGVRGLDEAPGVLRTLRLYWADHVVLDPNPFSRLNLEQHNQRELSVAVDSAHPEVVSVWNMGGLSLGLLTRLERKVAPLVLVVADDWLAYGPKFDSWTRQFAHRPRLARLVRRLTGLETVPPDLKEGSSYLAFASEHTRQRAIQWSQWRRADAVVIPWGVSRALFPEQPAAPWSGRLLYVGRLDPRKGIATLLRALALLSEHTLTFVGTGAASYRSELEQLAVDLGVESRVHWVGLVPTHEVVHHYAKADVCVFPSEWEEPFGLVPLEAMSCGRPVVATGTGGSREYLVDGYNCLLFTPGSAPALAGALARLRDEPPLLARLKEGGRATAKRLRFELFADELEAMHRAAAEQRT